MVPVLKKLIIYRGKHGEQRIKQGTLESQNFQRTWRKGHSIQNKYRTATQTYIKGVRKMKAWDELGPAKIS